MANSGFFNGIAPLTAKDMHQPTMTAGEAMGLFSASADGTTPSLNRKMEVSDAPILGQP